jgi:hypothetical protein
VKGGRLQSRVVLRSIRAVVPRNAGGSITGWTVIVVIVFGAWPSRNISGSPWNTNSSMDCTVIAIDSKLNSKNSSRIVC